MMKPSAIRAWKRLASRVPVPSFSETMVARQFNPRFEASRRLPNRSFAAMAVLLLATCSAGPSVKKDLVSTADSTNPFPEKILGHRLFLVFRSARQNLLGYSMRPGLEQVQIFGPRYWQGKERRGRGAGENRTIVFNRKQARRVGFALPGIGFSETYEGKVGFKLILKGLRVSQLNVPVLQQEYVELPEARTSPFVVSVLSADEVLIQALVKESGQTRLGSPEEARAAFAGRVRYSEKARGVVAGHNRIIGYVLARPNAHDLRRKATGESYSRLAIFDLEDRTGSSEPAFLAGAMRDKLEEAFQSIPRFHVVTDRKESARYHLKGSYARKGSQLQVELSITNTYNRKLVHKAVYVMETEDIDALYDSQLKIVQDFARKLGVKLQAGEKKRLQSIVRQVNDLERLKKYHAARTHFEKGAFKQCENAARTLTDADQRYLDAWLLHADCMLQLSRFKQARPVVAHALKLAVIADNPAALARAYQIQGRLRAGFNDAAGGLSSLEQGLEVLQKVYGDSHPKTAAYYAAVGWELHRAGARAKSPLERKTLLNRGEREYLKSLDILTRHYGPDDPRLIPTYSGLSNIQMELGKTGLAVTNGAAALRLSRKYLGLKHPHTGRYANHLGRHYRRQQRFADAEKLYLQSEAIFAHAQGDDTTLMRAANYADLGSLYYQKRQYAKALQWRLKNLRVCKKIFGHVDNHPRVLAAHGLVGHTLLALGDVPGALKHWRRGAEFESNMGVLGRHLRERLWVPAKDGEVPSGALLLGPDYNKKPLYACRVESKGDIYFGKVRRAYGACNYAQGGREQRAHKYRVLVMKQAARWEQAEDGEIRDSWRIMDVVVYGKSKKKRRASFLYLCRAKYRGSTVVGALRPGRTDTCRFGYGGVSYGSVKYEVLAEKSTP